MEEKKLDVKSILGFVLIFAVFMWMMMPKQLTKEEQAAKAKKEQEAKAAETAKKTPPTKVIAAMPTDSTAGDSAQLAKLRGTLGDFAYSATLPSAKENFTTIENKLVSLTIANKGGYIVDAKLKGYEKIKKGSGNLVELIKDNNAGLNIKMQTQDNRVIDTKNMYFEPVVTKSGENQILTMRLKAGADAFLEYQYVLKPNDYMLDFSVRSQGLNKVLNTTKPADLEWSLKSYRNEKSATYESRYADLRYEYEGDKNDYLGQGKDKTETVEKVSYIAFKQHFFTSILLTDKPFAKAELYSDNLVHDEKVDSVFTKQFRATVPLAFENGELNHKMNWYYGPTDYKTLKHYDRNIEKIVPLGWGIFGWINRYLFIPAYDVLSLIMSQGLAIIFFTILIKLLMSPVTYKSFLSQAKMKVLRPEIAELNEKFKKDPMKKQQETMKLYNKAGVNPMAGCIPALLQMPVFYALFQFFPSALSLRQEGFLWATDLSSFDSVYKLPFFIPLYGNHISLFPILASIAIFFYMKMTTGDQQASAPQQEGMPDMGKIMKVMIYISPLMMLIFFNNYASGLSLYYFISNLITIGIMLVIKNYIVDNDKIHAQIQQNKLKEPKKQGGFQRKLQEMMEQAEAEKAKKK
ncbi:membrane protein insertase YidC [Flavobacterium pallidum]|uniref:Membrane protein insertase YidC n=1 Tax=Flavobacterium pallidum TaxID=2172098 RepID=A0A2S1SIA0_9FLAO|nr:membrane protein insertase YidC [Flavobacterium pallidum]AWI26115.1 membrane protein insertase YidC [Flavobacterium pallidum]